MQEITIVLVDGSEIDLFIHETILKKAGYQDIISFTNPEEALAYLRECNGEYFIATDINFPLYNGFSFIDKVLSLENLDEDPEIIVLTASLNNVDREQARKRDIRFVTKPLDVSMIQTIFR